MNESPMAGITEAPFFRLFEKYVTWVRCARDDARYVFVCDPSRQGRWRAQVYARTDDFETLEAFGATLGDALVELERALDARIASRVAAAAPAIETRAAELVTQYASLIGVAPAQIDFELRRMVDSERAPDDVAYDYRWKASLNGGGIFARGPTVDKAVGHLGRILDKETDKKRERLAKELAALQEKK